MLTIKRRHRRIKRGVYVKVFAEGMDLRRQQGSLLHVDIVQPCKRKETRNVIGLSLLVLRGGPDDLGDVGNKLIRSRVSLVWYVVIIWELSKLVCVSPSCSKEIRSILNTFESKIHQNSNIHLLTVMPFPLSVSSESRLLAQASMLPVEVYSYS